MAAAQAPPQKPAFEVISIKVNMQGLAGDTTMGRRGDLLDGKNVTLRMLLLTAYVLPDGRFLNNDQIIGVPSWIDGPDRFAVQAKLRANTIAASPTEVAFPDEVRLMLQSLLENRFQLKTHKETRELPAYELMIAKKAKIRASANQTTPDLSGKPAVILDPSMPLSRGAVKVTQNLTQTGWTQFVITGSAVPMSALSSRLESNIGHSVIDKTGLTGLFDFRLEFVLDTFSSATGGAPALSDKDRGGPSVFDALQDQLGLKLMSTKTPTEVLVIDSIQKPSEN
jgi:uncharacterized protein (TIGR03435 family)